MNTVSKINLSNLKKCNQIWADMPETERGRLCLKCKNTIIDFRGLTDSEIAETHIFSEQRVCGIYSREQLRKPKPQAGKLKLSKLKSAYVGLFSLLSLNSYGQEGVEGEKTEQTVTKFSKELKIVQNEVHVKSGLVKDSVIISGSITGENNETLPFANVYIKDTKIGVTTDYYGYYRFNITESLDSLHSLTLCYSYLGFIITEMEIDSSLAEEGSNRVINVQLKEGEIIEFVVSEKQSIFKKIWHGIKNSFRSKK